MVKKIPFLVPPSSNWRGTIGACVRPQDFQVYVASITAADMEKDFAPNKIIIHNTGLPTFKQWRRGKVYPNRMEALTSWYRDKQSPPWKGGPHLFVDDKGLWLFNPLWKQGTHSPSFNPTSWGIEMVGDYDQEPFDEGPGAKIRDNSALAAAVLLDHLGLPANGKTILLHREDKKTTHACPGKNVIKDDFVRRVQEVMETF
jgi:hypothetical protein